MTDTWSKSFSYVWNVGSGILDDKNSKISRLVFFAIAFVGIIFACFMFYRAEIPFNTKGRSAVQLQIPGIINDKQTMGNLQNQSEKFTFLQSNAEKLANSMDRMNRGLFTDEAVGAVGNIINPTLNGNSEIELPSETQIVDSKPPIRVSGIIISNKSQNNLAVIDVNGKKGILVKKGSSIPDLNAKVISINSKGLKIKADGKIFDYSF